MLLLPNLQAEKSKLNITKPTSVVTVAKKKVCYGRRLPPERTQRTRLSAKQTVAIKKALVLAVSRQELVRPGLVISAHEVHAALMVAQKASNCLDITPRTARRLLATIRRSKRNTGGSKMGKQLWRNRKRNSKALPIRCTEAHLYLDKSSTPVEICARLHDVGAYRQLGSKVGVLMLQGLSFDETCVMKLLELLAQRPGIFCVNLGELPDQTIACWQELHKRLVSTENGVVFCFVDSITYTSASILFHDLGIKRRNLEEGWETSNEPPQWRRRSTLHALLRCSPESTPTSALWGMASWCPKRTRDMKWGISRTYGIL